MTPNALDHFHLKFIQAMIWRDNASVSGFPQFPVNFLEFAWYVTVIYPLSGNGALSLTVSQCELDYWQSLPGNTFIKRFLMAIRKTQATREEMHIMTPGAITWTSALSCSLHVNAVDKQQFCHTYSWQIPASSVSTVLSVKYVLQKFTLYTALKTAKI